MDYTVIILMCVMFGCLGLYMLSLILSDIKLVFKNEKKWFGFIIRLCALFEIAVMFVISTITIFDCCYLI